MAIAASTTMSNNCKSNNNSDNNKEEEDHDDHEHDMVMPGFRFHPTEEELVEFYLRRKVEGKRFNLELITFLDLYRYDPWELPALAAIGEKEWFFYVPRDRKYRNGDRPNRVTTSGYWKATGADRMVRSENSRLIGLKKTLVFYSGKAPKGIRTGWIMNEYRLPQHETERYQKTEISLCRVYKRAGMEDHPSLPRSFQTRAAAAATSSRATQSDQSRKYHVQEQAFGGCQSQPSQPLDVEKMSTETDGSVNSSDVTTVLGLSKQNVYRPMPSIDQEDQAADIFLNHSKQQVPSSMVIPNCTTLFPGGSSSVNSSSNAAVEEFHRLFSYQQASMNHQQQHYYNEYHHHHHQNQQQQQQQQHLQFSPLLPQISQPLSLNSLPATSIPAAFSDRLWEWNPIPEASREYNDPFK